MSHQHPTIKTRFLSGHLEPHVAGHATAAQADRCWELLSGGQRGIDVRDVQIITSTGQRAVRPAVFVYDPKLWTLTQRAEGLLS